MSEVDDLRKEVLAIVESWNAAGRSGDIYRLYAEACDALETIGMACRMPRVVWLPADDNRDSRSRGDDK